MKKMFAKLNGNRRGFVLIELLIAVAIIAALSAVAVPSVISVNNSLKSKQADDYAQSIYLSAQTTLTNMKITQPQTLSTDTPPGTELEAGKTFFVVSGGSGYDTLLPSGSIDSSLRGQMVMIVYHPRTGEVSEVFFMQNADAEKAGLSGSNFTYANLKAVQNRKAIHLGHYAAANLSTVPTQQQEEEKTDPALNLDDNLDYLTYENNYGTHGDGVLIVKIPVPTGMGYADFSSNLSFTLSMQGLQSAATFDNLAAMLDGPSQSTMRNGTLAVSYTIGMDSLYGSSKQFKDLFLGFLAGENVCVTLGNVTVAESENFNAADSTVTRSLDFNPLFAKLENNTITLSNARNLQNLDACAREVQQTVSVLELGDSFVWYGDKDFVPLNLWDELTTIDGKDKTISNIGFPEKTNGQLNNIGLVSELSITVQNLTLADVSFDQGNCPTKIMGAFAGTATSTAVLNNCKATNVTLTPKNLSSGNCAGGLVGISNGATIEGCAVTGLTIDASTAKNSSSIGGLVGIVNGGSITGCSVDGTISGANVAANVGGAIGQDNSAFNDSTVAAYEDIAVNVKLTGWGGTANANKNDPSDPSTLGVKVGKFVGYVYNGSFKNCSSADKSSDKNYHFLGKIACELDNNFSAGSFYFRDKDPATGNFLVSGTNHTAALAAASESAAASSLGLLASNALVSYSYDATLDTCTFYAGTSQYQQILENTYWKLTGSKNSSLYSQLMDAAIDIFADGAVPDRDDAEYGSNAATWPAAAAPVFLYDTTIHGLVHEADPKSISASGRQTQGYLIGSVSTSEIEDALDASGNPNTENYNKYLWRLFHDYKEDNTQPGKVIYDEFFVYANKDVNKNGEKFDQDAYLSCVKNGNNELISLGSGKYNPAYVTNLIIGTGLTFITTATKSVYTASYTFNGNTYYLCSSGTSNRYVWIKSSSVPSNAAKIAFFPLSSSATLKQYIEFVKNGGAPGAGSSDGSTSFIFTQPVSDKTTTVYFCGARALS